MPTMIWGNDAFAGIYTDEPVFFVCHIGVLQTPYFTASFTVKKNTTLLVYLYFYFRVQPWDYVTWKIVCCVIGHASEGGMWLYTKYVYALYDVSRLLRKHKQPIAWIWHMYVCHVGKNTLDRLQASSQNCVNSSNRPQKYNYIPTLATFNAGWYFHEQVA